MSYPPASADDRTQTQNPADTFILDAVASLIVLLDETGRIVHFNRACESSTGRPRATVIGRPFADVFTPEAPSGDADASLAETTHLAPDGSTRSIAWARTPVAEGPAAGHVV